MGGIETPRAGAGWSGWEDVSIFRSNSASFGFLLIVSLRVLFFAMCSRDPNGEGYVPALCNWYSTFRSPN